MSKEENIIKYAVRLSWLYVWFIVLSFLISMSLPSLHEVRDVYQTKCYWTDAMFMYVKCGDGLAASEFLSFVYNFWLKLLFTPTYALMTVFAGVWSIMFYFIGKTILIYSPLVFLIYAFIRRRKSKITGQ